MALPTNISTGTVVGQFISAVADSSDVDKLPESVPLTGTVTFIASPLYVLDYSADPNPVTIAKDPIICPLDDEGYVCSPYVTVESPLSRGVILVATDDPDLLPVGWTWSVLYNLYGAGGKKINLPNQTISVPAGTTVDLTTAMNVASSNGTVITKGDKGDPGDLVGVTTSSWTGAVALTEYPQTYLATLTGNVTAITLPSSPTALKSGTLTLILTQDATGGRTITWPASVKWAEGIVQQPATTASTISVFYLMWTGTAWFGMLGGKSFA